MSDNEDLLSVESDVTDGLPQKKLNGKIIVMAAAGLVVFGAVVFFIVTGGNEDEAAPDRAEARIEELAQQTATTNAQRQAESDRALEELQLLFVELKEQLYNLNTQGSGNSFLKLKVTLEVDRESYKAEIEQKMPRILDELNVYLRELRPSDLNGGLGIALLKEELLMRINQAVAPTRVKDVLLQDFVIQGS